MIPKGGNFLSDSFFLTEILRNIIISKILLVFVNSSDKLIIRKPFLWTFIYMYMNKRISFSIFVCCVKLYSNLSFNPYRIMQHLYRISYLKFFKF